METSKRLTKTKLIGYLQCSKRLWLETYRKDLIRWSPESQALLALGRSLGEAVRALYPSGILIGDVFNPTKALAETRELLGQEAPVILFEPAFRHAGVLVRADVFFKEASGCRFIEVKSARRPRPEHIQDLSVQSWVIEGAGYPLESAALATITPAFEADEAPLNGRLQFYELMDKAKALYPDIERWVSQARDILGRDMPEIEPGEQCVRPYACPFREFCG